MNKAKLDGMRSPQLLELFTEVALQQDRALLGDDIAMVNRLYDRLKDIEAELKSRSGDQRRELLSLYDHPNPQVRLKAIKATLAVVPARARAALETLRRSREYPQSGEAGMTVWAIEEGIYTPS